MKPKTQKILYICVTFFLLNVAYGQTSQILIGDTIPGFYHATYSPVYKIQDTVYDMGTSATNHVVPVDIDGDNVKDLSITSAFYGSFNGSFWYPVWSCGLLLDSLTDVVSISNAIDTLSFGDTLNASANWYHGPYGDVKFCWNVNNYTMDTTWKDQDIYYAGLRLRKVSGDTLYGWLKVRVQGYHTVYLEELACLSANPKDTTINFIKDNPGKTNSIFKVFPNPFCTQVTLQLNHPLNNATLTVENCFGQRVAQIRSIYGQTITFSRSHLVSGMYIFRLYDNNKIYTEKVLIVDK